MAAAAYWAPGKWDWSFPWRMGGPSGSPVICMNPLAASAIRSEDW